MINKLLEILKKTLEILKKALDILPKIITFLKTIQTKKNMPILLDKESLKRKNFKPFEFFKSETAKKLGVINYPNPEEEQEILRNLNTNADTIQSVRDRLGYPITINSAYRCKIVNDAVGSKDTSQHLQGLAVDFVCPKFGTPYEIVKYLHSIGFVADQVFCEGSWVHLSKVPEEKENRMMYGTYLPDENGVRRFKAIA